MANPSSMLPLPPREDYRDNSMWVDEQIWGHRLWDSESPWLLFLEFLNVAEAGLRTGKLFQNVTLCCSSRTNGCTCGTFCLTTTC